MGVAPLTISAAWCKNGALYRYSLKASSVPSCLLWQSPPLSVCCHYRERDSSFSCVGGRDRSMWCSVSLIKMTWLFCHAIVSQRGGRELKHLILFRLALPLCGVGLSWALMRMWIWQLCRHGHAYLSMCTYERECVHCKKKCPSHFICIQSYSHK